MYAISLLFCYIHHLLQGKPSESTKMDWKVISTIDYRLLGHRSERVALGFDLLFDMLLDGDIVDANLPLRLF
jgi:hypothetical protein